MYYPIREFVIWTSPVLFLVGLLFLVLILFCVISLVIALSNRNKNEPYKNYLTAFFILLAAILVIALLVAFAFLRFWA